MAEGAKTNANEFDNLRDKFEYMRQQAEEQAQTDADAQAEVEKAAADRLEKMSQNPIPLGKTKLVYWEPEDDIFWKLWGWKVGLPNMAVSAYCLVLYFAIWTQWGGIVKNINAANKADPNVYAFGFDLPGDKKKRAAAIGLAGTIGSISGACSRAVSSYMVYACGGRTINFMNCVMGIVPMLFAFIALSNSNASLWLLYFCAIGCGIGGGGFSSNIPNISYFAPRRLQGTFTGLTAGIGNLGVSLHQQVVPFISANGLAVTGKTGEGEGMVMGGKYVYQVGVFWTIVLLIGAILSLRLTHDQPTHGDPEGRMLFNIQYYLRIYFFGYAGGVVAGLILFATNDAVVGISAAIIIRALFLAFFSGATTTMALFWFSRGVVKERINVPLDVGNGKKYGLLRDKNTIVLTLLYIMTFASFIGYAGAFGGLITNVYGKNADGTKNPDGPQVADYSYLGAFVGSLARAFGGPLSDYAGGALLTAIAMTLQIVGTFGMSIIVRVTLGAPDRVALFTPFLICILVLFIGTGIGNASTFKQMGMLFEPIQRGPMMGFSAACAAYGAFVVPTLVGAGVTGDFVDIIFYVFIIYYGFCGFLNYWYYLRRNAEFPC
jgi:NNP family nitrate/nitrite transporter-like MFS transporter